MHGVSGCLLAFSGNRGWFIVAAQKRNPVIQPIPTGAFMAIDLKSLNLTQLRDLMRRAELREKELLKERTARVRAKMVALAKSEGLSFDEVVGRASPRRKTKSVKPKYRNPVDGSTWSGRGKRPRWFNDALKSGKKEKDLLIG
jgi:DNA-binding protein H-NS